MNALLALVIALVAVVIFGNSGSRTPNWPSKTAKIGTTTQDGKITWIQIGKVGKYKERR
jgi:hypothetical protein